MRALLWISVVLMALWSGYWFVGKRAADQAVGTFFQQASAQGLVAEHAGYSIEGFPNRFDLTVQSPRLSDSRSGIAWQAPFIQILSLSYKPWHVIAAFAPTQTVTTPQGDIVVNSTKLQASVVVTPNTTLTLDRTTLIGTGVTLASSLGWTLKAGDLRFATRQDPSRPNTHEIGLDLLEVTPDAQIAALFPDLPTGIERLRLDAFAGFSAPIDRFAGQTRPELQMLNIHEASLTWGDLAIFAKGDLVLSQGTPEGRIDIRLQGWRRIMPLIRASGAVKPEVLPTVEKMLETLATQGGNPEVLDLPLIFTAGQMRLGPLPIGPAPRF